MLTPQTAAQIFLYEEPVDMRKSFDGLSEIVERSFQERVVSGSYFAFLNRQRDRIKVLYWDLDGLVIWYKRLEKGSFSRVGQKRLTRREFLMLLEDITPKRLGRRFFLD